jgi:hypothetical protein
MSWKSKRENETGWHNLVCFFLIVLHIWFINLNCRDALSRASVVPSRTSSPTQSAGTIPSQCSNGYARGLCARQRKWNRPSLHSSGRVHARNGQYHISSHSKIIPVCTNGESISFGVFSLSADLFHFPSRGQHSSAPVSRKKPLPPNSLAQKPTYCLATSHGKPMDG